MCILKYYVLDCVLYFCRVLVQLLDPCSVLHRHPERLQHSCLCFSHELSCRRCPFPALRVTANTYKLYVSCVTVCDVTCCNRWSITPMMYPATFVFNEPSAAYIALIVANLFVGVTCIITSFLLEIFQLNDPVSQKNPPSSATHPTLLCFRLLLIYMGSNFSELCSCTKSIKNAVR